MANISLKRLFEAEDFQAKSKETGKLVHFKSKDSYQAALKAGTHTDPKAEKGDAPKADAKPNSMFGGDYSKDRGGEAPKASPKINSKNWKPDEDGSMSDEASDDVQNYLNDVLGADGLAEVDYNTGNIQYGLADSENSIFVGYADGTYNVSFEGPSMDIDKINQSYKSFKNPKEALLYAGELAKANMKGLEMNDKAPKADVKSIVKDLLKNGDKEFRGAYKLADVVDDFKDSVDDSDEDGAELKARLDKGENGVYVQTDETEGTVVFNDGSQYQFSHVEDGPIPVTKVGKEEPKTSSKLTSMLPKKASQLDYKHSNIVADTVNKEAGLDGYAQTDDNSGAIMYNGSKGDTPTYTLYFGMNDDYGKPDEFRVSLLSTYGNDPSNIDSLGIDKSFKSSEDAMKFMTAVAKKYKKELEMDDED